MMIWKTHSPEEVQTNRRERINLGLFNETNSVIMNHYYANERALHDLLILLHACFLIVTFMFTCCDIDFDVILALPIPT